MSMKYESFQKYTGVTVQPAVRLVALFEEAVEYDRRYLLPFHTLELCARDNPADPTWCEIGGKREIFPLGQVRFIAAMTPMHIRCTFASHKLAIHFRCELLPGVDLLSGLRGRFVLEEGDGPLAAKIKAVFADPDPLRRVVRAEAIAYEAILPLWPKQMPLELVKVAPYADALRAVQATVNARTRVGDLAERMGLPATRFPRAFRALVGMAPKDWLEKALLDRASRLLADRRRTIRDIAYALKFSTEFNFSRFIRRQRGYSPSQWRQALRNR